MSFPSPSEKQARIIWFALTSLAVVLTVAIIGALLWGLGLLIRELSTVIWPLAVAAIIAYLLDPLVDRLVARGVPRLRAIMLVFAVAAVLVVGVLGSIVPYAVVQARDLAGRVPTYIENARIGLEKWFEKPTVLRFLPQAWRDRLDDLRGQPGAATTNAPATVPTNAPSGRPGAPLTNRTEGITAAAGTNGPVATPPGGEAAPWWEKALDPRTLTTAGGWVAAVAPEVGRWFLGQVGRVASWFGVLAGMALIPIYTFYLLLEKRGIKRSWTDYLPVSNSKFKDELVWLLENINDALIVFFRGQVLVAMCDGVLYTIGFLIIGLPYALLIGLMASVLTIVPFLGAIVTCAAALVIALVQFGDWQHPLLVLVVFAVVQVIEGWVLQPKIIGDRVGLHPMTIIVALLVGVTLLGGLLGGLLAIPLTAALRAVMFRYVWKKRGAEPDGAKPARRAR